jgi:hypothetical protein
VVSIGRFGEMRLGDVGSYRYAINMDANAARNVIEDREKRFLCFSVIRLKAARGTADNPYAMSFTSMIRGSREEQYLEINTSFLGTYLVDVHTNSVIGKWIPKTADQ